MSGMSLWCKFLRVGLLAATASLAIASPMTFTTHGTFADGGAFAGTFVFDPQQAPSPPNPPTLDFVGPFTITSTHGSILDGFMYFGGAGNGSAQVSPCGVIQFSFAMLNQSQLVLSVPGLSFAGFGGGPIVSSCAGSSRISFEQLSPPTGAYRMVTEGSVDPVPEPTALLMVVFGLIAGSVIKSRW
jgi:hypothetical protein